MNRRGKGSNLTCTSPDLFAEHRTEKTESLNPHCRLSRAANYNGPVISEIIERIRNEFGIGTSFLSCFTN
jgi:hypothetical protein